MHLPHSIRPTCTRAALTIVMMWVMVAAGRTQAQTAPVAAIEPIVVWPSGPLDVVAAFENPLSPAAAASLVGKSIPFFEPARPAGDRAAGARPSGSLRIAAARLTDAGRTLTLATDPHPRLARYMLPLPEAPGGPRPSGSGADKTNYDLCGLNATLTERGSLEDRVLWSGWWPSLDFNVTRKLTRGSKRHEVELALLAKQARLELGTLVRLPRGRVTVRVESNQPIEEAQLGDAPAEMTTPAFPSESYFAVLTAPSQGDPLFLFLALKTAANGRPAFSLKASYRVDDEKIDHAIERERLILPWAPLPTPGPTPALVVPDLAGGDLARGQAIFKGEKARCSACHSFQGQGGKIGPDLTGIGKKGRAELYRAIAAPSDSIEPDFISYSVATKSGQIVVGVVRAEGADAIRISDTNAHATSVSRQDIEQIRPSANSIMPVGLAGALGDAAMRDLIAFLTADVPQEAGATSRLLPLK